MNDFSRPYAGAPSMDMSQDAGLRAYMLGIYNTMVIGLVVTGIVAFGAAELFFTEQAGQTYFTPLGQSVLGSPLRWVVFLAPLGMVFLMGGMINKMSPATGRIVFYLFASIMGISISSIFVTYTEGSIFQTFLVTAAAFAGLSLFGYTTKKNLTGMGSFLIMGLFGIIIASVVNIFMQSDAISFAVSVLGVLIFAGLTAYDTQRLKLSYYEYGGDEVAAGRMSVMGALSLYLNFINMFLFLLRLFGNRE